MSRVELSWAELRWKKWQKGGLDWLLCSTWLSEYGKFFRSFVCHYNLVGIDSHAIMWVLSVWVCVYILLVINRRRRRRSQHNQVVVVLVFQLLIPFTSSRSPFFFLFAAAAVGYGVWRWWISLTKEGSTRFDSAIYTLSQSKSKITNPSPPSSSPSILPTWIESILLLLLSSPRALLNEFWNNYIEMMNISFSFPLFSFPLTHSLNSLLACLAHSLVWWMKLIL